MKEALKKIDEALRQDPGRRGLLTAAPENQVEQLVAVLEKGGRAALLTGFPVRKADGSVVGETDGPSGIAHIAWALEQYGMDVMVMTDEVSYMQVFAAMKARGCRSFPKMISHNKEDQNSLGNLMKAFRPTVCISLERPGKAEDGHYHNMRGEIIDSMITDTAEFIKIARELSADTISVGDGGNELGMGRYRELVERYVPHGDKISDTESTDVALISGVSNWWGWGIAAVVSMLAKKNLLPTPEMEKKVLEAVVRSGGVDGCTKESALSVDRLSLEEHQEVLETVTQAVDDDQDETWVKVQKEFNF